MAEAYLRREAGDRLRILSAGLNPHSINPYTIRVMDEVGIDIRSHTSNHLNEYVGATYFDYVITVCAHADANCPGGVYAMAKKKLHWPFDDPAAVTGSDEDIMATFRRVRDEIEQQVVDWVAELKARRRFPPMISGDEM